MARSLRGGSWQIVKDTFARSVAVSLKQRDIISDAEGKVDDVNDKVDDVLGEVRK